MDIITFVERATVVYNPDGSIKGSEAHQHTGYFEQRDTAEGPMTVFVAVKNEVRPVLAGDFEGLLPCGPQFLKNAGQELADKRDNRRQHLADAYQRISVLERQLAESAESVRQQSDIIRNTKTELESERAGRRADQDKATQAMRQMASDADATIKALKQQIADIASTDAGAA